MNQPTAAAAVNRLRVTPTGQHGATIDITPTSAGWGHVGFTLVHLDADAGVSSYDLPADDRERAVIAQRGHGEVFVDGTPVAQLARDSVFTQMSALVYVPAGSSLRVTTDGPFTFAIGSAPATVGSLSTRVITPAEMRTETRGGGAAYRQVVHILAPPLAAERLIMYEVYVPRGTWSGWPPHCHDGQDGSPYLEETYYFRLDRPEGFATHRNWRHHGDDPFDDTVVVGDGEVALVPAGYHSSVACPGANMYFLNVLAGDLLFDERATPPCFAAEHVWIADDWTVGQWNLPVVRQ
jgi:5-deoxy-glucuronate isomerase